MRSKKAAKARRKPLRPVVVPREFGGKWIAWNRDRSAIVGSGNSLKEAEAAARSSGTVDPGFEWVPPANRRLIGFRR